MRPSVPPPRRPFARLQWQLTLWYMAATTLATLVLELLLLIGGAIALLASPTLPGQLQTALAGAVAPLAAPLSASPPDRAALVAWLRRFEAELPPVRGIVLSFAVDEPGARAVIVDPAGVIQATWPERATLSDPERALVTAALSGVAAPASLSERTSAFVLHAAAPVRAADGTLRGAIFFHVEPLSDSGNLGDVLWKGVVPGALLVGLLSGVSGALAGYFAARRITWRLGAIEASADAWAAGDFSAQAPTAGDELGLLAARLNRMAADLRDLMTLRQDIATLEERQRLARELHDTVKQQVFATVMQLGAARALLPRDPDTARARLDVADELARQAQKDLTAILSELRPVSPDSGGTLPALLRSHAEGWSRRTGVALTLAIDPERAPTGAVAAALLRICQEALANVERHAGARKVELTLAGDGERGVRLTIRDDGAGFDPGAAARRTEGGLGLSSMRERAEALPGGRFDLLSAPGAGTVLQVRTEAPE